MGRKIDLSSVDRSGPIEAELTVLCEALGEELAKPARARDDEKVLEQWQHIDSHRPKVAGFVREMRWVDGALRSGLKAQEGRAMRSFRQRRKNLQRRLSAWEQIGRMVHRHVAPELNPLIPQGIPMRGDPLTELLARALHRAANPGAQSDTAGEHGCFSDIPLPVMRFDALMIAAYRLLLARKRTEGVRFMDVGCGGGTKLMIARRYFDVCTGLEYDRGYVDVGRDFLSRMHEENTTIEHGDALSYTGYDQFDVIYFYRPMTDDYNLALLEEQVVRHARPGTLILAPYDIYFTARTQIPCTQVSGPIFAVGMSQEEVDEWREDAEHGDTTIVSRSDALDFDLGYWRPLIDASWFDVITS